MKPVSNTIKPILDILSPIGTITPTGKFVGVEHCENPFFPSCRRCPSQRHFIRLESNFIRSGSNKQIIKWCPTSLPRETQQTLGVITYD